VKWWSAATQWRNWPLQVKLGMVLVVPVIGAGILGVLRVQNDVQLASSYAATERIADLRAQLLSTLTAIQNERTAAVRQSRDLDKLAAKTDAEIRRANAAVEQTTDLGPDATQRFQYVTDAVDVLHDARAQVAKRDDGDLVLGSYDVVTGAVLDFDRALIGRFPDAELTNISISLNELQAAREQVGIQHAVGLIAVRNGKITDFERTTLVKTDARLDDNLNDFRAVAPDALRQGYEATVSGPDVIKRQSLVRAARIPGIDNPRYTEDEWNTSFDATTDLMFDVTKNASNSLREKSAALSDDFGTRAGVVSAVLLLVALLALGIGFVIARYLLRSVGVLRSTALDVAHSRLPAAVESIRAGETEKATIDPVPLHTTEEFGQLARAFDAVHAQAVRSAVEEAGLRGNLASIFTNLSRRSQGLVERQLRLMEQLEEQEDDPDQLSNLFKIDHLATRMRRNNENLMVLSGAGLSRRFTEPMPLPDVLRAAVSEVEHYQRALVRGAPNVRIVGYVAGDLIRSLSELIENATKCSPPDTPVVIAGRMEADGSVLVDITDEGVGMADEELEEANSRVAAGGGVDVPVSRQMGLFVIGRLTARHGVRVWLSRRDDGKDGVRASVHVPVAVVVSGGTAAPAPAKAGPAQPPDTMPGMPIEVSEIGSRLEVVGIRVRLTDFPPATTPASILFAATVSAEEPAAVVAVADAPRRDAAFTWLDRPAAAETPGQAPPTSHVEHQTGPNGLPKRVPRGQTPGPPARERPAARTRDAERTRGFLSGFQSGVRRSEPREEATDG
jgi:signal transduction histidine kinase